MSPRSNVKLDSLAVLAATVTYSILEGKLDEIAFFSQQRQWLGGMIGWQPMMAHSAANKRVALTLLVSVNVMDENENFYRTPISKYHIYQCCSQSGRNCNITIYYLVGDGSCILLLCSPNKYPGR
jgi:hypothetical protein